MHVQTKLCQQNVTYAAFLDPVGDFLVSDVFAAGELEELVCLFLLQLYAPAALLIKFLVTLPQLQQCFAAAQALPDFFQQPGPPRCNYIQVTVNCCISTCG